MAAEEVPWLYGVHRQSYLIKHSWLRNYMTTDFEAGQAQYLDIDLNAKKELVKSL